jgi:hypothetical protein
VNSISNTTKLDLDRPIVQDNILIIIPRAGAADEHGMNLGRRGNQLW